MITKSIQIDCIWRKWKHFLSVDESHVCVFCISLLQRVYVYLFVFFYFLFVPSVFHLESYSLVRFVVLMLIYVLRIVSLLLVKKKEKPMTETAHDQLHLYNKSNKMVFFSSFIDNCAKIHDPQINEAFKSKLHSTCKKKKIISNYL